MTDEAAAIVQDLDAEGRLYADMLGLARSQREAVARKDYEAVASLLDRKQALMERIEAIEKRLGPAKQGWPELKARLSEEEVRAVQARVEAVGATLKLLMAEEEGVRADLARMQNSVGAELRNLMQSRKGTKAYGGPGVGKPDPRFFDRKE